MLDYTPARIALFVELASERRNLELVQMAQAMAVGAGTGFSGDPKILERHQRALLGHTKRAGASMQSDLQGRLQQMARAAGAVLPRPGETARNRAREARAKRGRSE